MRRLGFGPNLIAVVLKCISTPVFSVVINGRVGDAIIPGRGLRQGCPLSPYLFIICAEGFSALIRSHERLGLWRGFACGPRAPTVTHLLFADDSLLFCSATEENCRAIQSVLATYERGSGQVVNLDKSVFVCSRNVEECQIPGFMSLLGIPSTPELESYLGLPVRIGRRKTLVFSNITCRIRKQLLAWRAKMFSAGGREILIKAVAQAIPTYSMSLFRLPSTLIDDIHRMIARFWWGVRRKKRRFIGRGGIFSRDRSSRAGLVLKISGLSIKR